MCSHKLSLTSTTHVQTIADISLLLLWLKKKTSLKRCIWCDHNVFSNEKDAHLRNNVDMTTFRQTFYRISLWWHIHPMNLNAVCICIACIFEIKTVNLLIWCQHSHYDSFHLSNKSGVEETKSKAIGIWIKKDLGVCFMWSKSSCVIKLNSYFKYSDMQTVAPYSVNHVKLQVESSKTPSQLSQSIISCLINISNWHRKRWILWENWRWWLRSPRNVHSQHTRSVRIEIGSISLTADLFYNAHELDTVFLFLARVPTMPTRNFSITFLICRFDDLPTVEFVI